MEDGRRLDAAAVAPSPLLRPGTRTALPTTAQETIRRPAFQQQYCENAAQHAGWACSVAVVCISRRIAIGGELEGPGVHL